MSLKIKTTADIKALPSSLWQFYKSFAISGHVWLLTLWFVFELIAMSQCVIYPYIESLVMKIFEQPVPEGSSLLIVSIPFVLLAVGLNYALNGAWTSANLFQSKAEPKIKNQISEVLTAYAHNQSMAFWTSKMAGSVNSQINYISSGFDSIHMFNQMFGSFVIVLINGAVLLSLDKYIAIMLVCALFVRVIYTWKFSKKVKRISEQYSATDSRLSGKLVDSFVNHSIVKYFAGAKAEQQALVPLRNRHIFWAKVQARIYAFFWMFTGLLWDALYGVTIILCVQLFQQGKIMLSGVVYIISAYHFVMGAITQFMNDLPKFVEVVGKAKKAYKDLVMPITVVDKPDAQDLIVNKGIIEFKHVKFGYRNRPVLNDLSLRIKSGERVGIVGSSGAGKSTMVNLLMRFYDPKRGQILIDGQDIKDVKQDSLREHIAFIPQDPSMFNRTIGENIGYGKAGASRTEIRQAAKNAAADEFISATEKKYDSLVGDKGIKLSGGQRQRIAIARAFLKDAPILVLDEATSALDSETEVSIQKSFEKLSRGRTTIAIAHRLSTLRNMDRIIVLERGEIVEQGTHQQLLRKKGKYYQLWQMQSGGFLLEDKHA